MQTSIKVLLFKTNNRQDLCIEFEMRKKGKFERAEEFTKRIKEVYKKAEAVLRKYINRKRNKPEEYRVDN